MNMKLINQLYTSKYKFYGMVLRHLSPIQKSIQYSHCIVEYVNNHINDKIYKKWYDNDKTMVMLDVHGVNEFDKIIDMLKNDGISYECFYEPDLGNICTCICFIMEYKTYEDNSYRFLEDILDEKKENIVENNEIYQKMIECIKNKRISV